MQYKVLYYRVLSGNRIFGLFRTKIVFRDFYGKYGHVKYDGVNLRPSPVLPVSEGVVMQDITVGGVVMPKGYKKRPTPLLPVRKVRGGSLLYLLFISLRVSAPPQSR